MSLGVLQHVEGLQCLQLQSEAVQGTAVLQTVGYSSVIVSHPRRLEFESSRTLKRAENLGNLGVQNLSGRVFGTS